MQQIILINGGTTFSTHEEYMSFLREFEPKLERLSRKSWKDSLQENLGKEFEVLQLRMPNPMNAQYEEWKIYADKFAPLFDEKVILIGHSLGAVFLAKYLSETTFPKKIKEVFLLAPPYDDEQDESLTGFKITDDVNLANFATQVEKIFIYHSKDDSVVPFFETEKYKEKLPQAEIVVFEDKEHFSIPEFPELVQHIKAL